MAYIEWVELETFFSGYLIVFAIFYLLTSKQQVKNTAARNILRKLPLAYALVGTFYLGLQLKNLYPFDHITFLLSDIQFHYLKVWGLLSILFWVPFLHKRAVFSQLHSLVFFFLLMKGIYSDFFNHSSGTDMAGNNIKIFSVSLLLNLAAVLLIVLIYFMIVRLKKRKPNTNYTNRPE